MQTYDTFIDGELTELVMFLRKQGIHVQNDKAGKYVIYIPDGDDVFFTDNSVVSVNVIGGKTGLLEFSIVYLYQNESDQKMFENACRGVIDLAKFNSYESHLI